MKFMVLVASLCFGSLANATLYGYKCTGTTADTGDTITVRGGFDSSANEHVGNLTIWGTDQQPADSSFPGMGGANNPRFFPGEQVNVNYNAQAGLFTAEGHTSNRSEVNISVVRGSSGSFIWINLKRNSNFGPYQHRFKNARCKFRTGSLFPDEDYDY